MINMISILYGIGIVLIIVGLFFSGELVYRLGLSIFCFGILCQSYHKPMIGYGIEYGISGTLIFSLLVPFVLMGINLTKFYKALFLLKSGGLKALYNDNEDDDDEEDDEIDDEDADDYEDDADD
jgi:hypothetical protein